MAKFEIAPRALLDRDAEALIPDSTYANALRPGKTGPDRWALSKP